MTYGSTVQTRICSLRTSKLPPVLFLERTRAAITAMVDSKYQVLLSISPYSLPLCHTCTRARAHAYTHSHRTIQVYRYNVFIVDTATTATKIKHSPCDQCSCEITRTAPMQKETCFNPRKTRHGERPTIVYLC